ncbi:MAG: von Willebrand factor type A domain-containing protein [Fluviicola sp.]
MNRKEYNQEYDVFETPDTLWENIEKKLDEPRKRKIKWISTISSIAALLIITLLVFSNNQEYAAFEAKKEIAISQQQEAKPSNGSYLRSKQKVNKVARSQSKQEQKVKLNQGKVSTNMIADVSASNASVVNGYANMYYSAYEWSGNTRGDGSAPIGLFYRDGKAITPKYKPRLDEESTHGSTYETIVENVFVSTKKESVSTFSIDVDGASYSDVRGMIQRGVLPNPNAVRLEELINYFPYNYEEPKGEHPFAFHTEVVECPWNTEHQLMKIGIKGESIEKEALPPNNLVFLMDVSGSMTSPQKLGLIKKGLNLLVQEMREEDRVAICVYAGAAGLVLEPTSGANKDKIMDAINRLEAGGSTAGGEGIELAYATAQKYFNSKGNNRVILATDGDFNVGVSNDDALVELIERKRESGVALTVLGVGHDNFQSSKMEKLANNGNGNFSYIDNILEAKKVLVTEMGATLKTIAKDVKLQLDFNPEKVESYRLIGYENRLLANEDFDNDAVDAGELGAGHTVTAIYEIIPAKNNSTKSQDFMDELESSLTGKKYNGDDLAVLKFRYKEPQGSTSKLIQTKISEKGSICSTDMRFITAVVEFGLLLRNSEFKGTANFDRILKNARQGLGRDPYGYRTEFIELVQKTQRLKMAN